MARPPPPPTLARSVLALGSFFRCSLGRLGAVRGGGRARAGPTECRAAAIPTVGPAAAAAPSCTQSNTRPPHCSVCCLTRPTCTSEGGGSRDCHREIKPFLFGQIGQQLEPREAYCQENFLLQSDVAFVKTLLLVTAFAKQTTDPAIKTPQGSGRGV